MTSERKLHPPRTSKISCPTSPFALMRTSLALHTESVTGSAHASAFAGRVPNAASISFDTSHGLQSRARVGAATRSGPSCETLGASDIRVGCRCAHSTVYSSQDECTSFVVHTWNIWRRRRGRLHALARARIRLRSASQRAACSVKRTQPGGQRRLRPPRTCMCTCQTLCPASALQLRTTR